MQNFEGIDPNIMQRRAQGANAQSQIAELLRGPQMQQAMAMQNQQMAPLQRGQSANMLSAISNLATRRRGQSDARNIQNQIAALRGQSEQGQIAGMEYEQALKNQAFKQNEMMAQQARDDRANDIRGNMEVWEDKDGNEVVVGMTADGPVDSERRPMTLEGFRPTQKIGANTKSRSGYGKWGLSAPASKKVEDSYAKIISASNIKKMASEFTQSDADTLNAPALSQAISTVTPEAWENYVKNNQRNWSPRVTRLMNAMSALGAEQRNALFGAALTKQEGGYSERFIVGADGLDLGDSMLRLDNLVDMEKATLEAIDRANGSETLGDDVVKSYKYYQSPEDRQEGAPKAPTVDIQALGQQLQNMSSRLQQLQQKAGEP